MSNLKDFEVIKTLGSGSYSCVYKVKRKSDGQEYAMKKVKLLQLKPKEKENALNEVRILASITDPCIIGYKEAFIDESSQTLCIIMEQAGGGDLLNKINFHKKASSYFSEETVWSYLIQMTKGIRTLHGMKILHRDLKCANIFLSADESCAKIGDLNVSKVAKKGLVYTQTGTPYYASPEVWRDEPYDAKSDIWSLGCVLYEMVTLKPPFRANDMDGLYRRVQKGIFDKIPSRYSTDLANVIALCLTVSPSLRPSCDQILNNPAVVKRNPDAYKGPYFANNGAPNGVNRSQDLLSTIKMPRNIKGLSERLPKANYQSGATKVNQSFDLQTIQRSRDPQSINDRGRIVEIRRASSSHSRKPSAEGSRSPLQKDPSGVLGQGRRQPVRGMSLDPDSVGGRAGYLANPVYKNNSRSYLQPISSPGLKCVSNNISNQAPVYRKIGNENSNSSPYQRLANNILKPSNGQNVSLDPKDGMGKPPTPGQYGRGRKNYVNDQNANPFVDVDRKQSLLTKITSNNVLRSLDVNSNNSYKENIRHKVANQSPVRNSSNNVLGNNKYYLPQSNSSRIDALLANQHVSNSKSKIATNNSGGSTPQKVGKPVWLV